MNARLEIDTLRALKAIQDTGGVSRAAEALLLSQSAVSHKILRLEQNINCKILRRKRGGSLFTEDGQQLIRYAERIIEIHDEAIAGMNRSPLKGRIRLGITEEMVTTGLSKVLGRFSRLYPGIHVKTVVDQSLGLKERLRKTNIDMAVMQVFKEEVLKGDSVIREDRLVWVKSRDYQMPDGNRIPFIAFDQNCFYRKWAEVNTLESNKKLDVLIECGSNEGVCSAILAGMGISLIGERLIKSDMETIDLDFAKPSKIVFVLRTASSQITNQLSALRDEIINSLTE